MDTLYWNTNLRSDNHMRAPLLAPSTTHPTTTSSSSNSNSKPDFVTALNGDNEDGKDQDDDDGTIDWGKGVKGASIVATIIGGDVQGRNSGLSASQPAATITTPTKTNPSSATTRIGKGAGSGAGFGSSSSPSGSGVVMVGGQEHGLTSSSVSVPATSVPLVPPAPPPAALTEVPPAEICLFSLSHLILVHPCL